MEGDVEGWAHDYSSRLLALPFSFLSFFFFLSQKDAESLSLLYIYIRVRTLASLGAICARSYRRCYLSTRKGKKVGKRERERSIIRFQTRREELILPDIDKNVMFSLFGTWALGLRAGKRNRLNRSLYKVRGLRQSHRQIRLSAHGANPRRNDGNLPISVNTRAITRIKIQSIETYFSNYSPIFISLTILWYISSKWPKNISFNSPRKKFTNICERCTRTSSFIFNNTIYRQNDRIRFFYFSMNPRRNDGNILELFSFRFYVLVNEPTFSGNAYMYTSQIGLERDSWLAWRKSWLSSQQVTRRIFRYVSACLEFECFTLGQSPSPSSSPRFNLLIFVFVVYSSLRLGTRCVVAYVHPATGDEPRRFKSTEYSLKIGKARRARLVKFWRIFEYIVVRNVKKRAIPFVFIFTPKLDRNEYSKPVMIKLNYGTIGW